MILTLQSNRPTRYVQTSFSSSSAVGSCLVPSLVLSMWMWILLVMTLGLPLESMMVFTRGARKALSFPVSVLASRMVISASVAEEKNLKPDIR